MKVKYKFRYLSYHDTIHTSTQVRDFLYYISFGDAGDP